MAESLVEFATDGGVATITLNRPKALNSFTDAMHSELRVALDEVVSSDALRALVLTGAGRGFCAGQDLNDRATSPEAGPPDLGHAIENNWNPLIRTLTEMPKPVIGAINGVAAGAGASVALACDIVIAARSASFVQVFSNIGLIPDSGGSWHLPRALSLPRAKALAMTGEKLPAEQAEAWGMIWKCVDDDQLAAEAQGLAQTLAARPTQALGAIKAIFASSSTMQLAEHLEIEKATMARLGKSEDYAEGVRAFLEKRAPNFSGK